MTGGEHDEPTGEEEPAERQVVVLDACVLFPASVRDLLMSLAADGLFVPKWTEVIHREWVENVLQEDKKRNNPPRLDRAKLENTRDLMNRVLPYALVTGHDHWIPVLLLPDPADRHVLAAALESDASIIVTFNLRHFPASALAPHGVQALHSDSFLCTLYDNEPERFRLVLRTLLSRLTNPPRTLAQYRDKLRQVGLKDLAARLKPTTEDT